MLPPALGAGLLTRRALGAGLLTPPLRAPRRARTRAEQLGQARRDPKARSVSRRLSGRRAHQAVAPAGFIEKLLLARLPHVADLRGGRAVGGGVADLLLRVVTSWGGDA